MNLQKLKTIHDSLLRGACCAIWVFGLIIGFYQLLYAIAAETGSAEESTHVLHLIICLAVTIGAAITHAYLINQCEK